MNSLIIQNIVKQYKGRKVVDDVSFEVNEGEVVGLPEWRKDRWSFYIKPLLVETDVDHPGRGLANIRKIRLSWRPPKIPDRGVFELGSYRASHRCGTHRRCVIPKFRHHDFDIVDKFFGSEIMEPFLEAFHEYVGHRFCQPSANDNPVRSE